MYVRKKFISLFNVKESKIFNSFVSLEKSLIIVDSSLSYCVTDRHTLADVLLSNNLSMIDDLYSPAVKLSPSLI